MCSCLLTKDSLHRESEEDKRQLGEGLVDECHEKPVLKATVNLSVCTSQM